MDRPYQIVLLLLQKMELLLQKTPEDQLKAHVLPLIYNAVGSETIKVQELCLSIIPSIGRLVDRNAMKNQLLPKLLKMATDGNVLSVKVQTLVCLGKLMPSLEQWMITEQIIPTLPKISSKEPGILMAILGIYKLASEMEQCSLAREQLAKSVLPFLIATSVENTLNLSQFEQYMALTKKLLTKVETEQRSRLQQLSASQEEQRNVQDFTAVLKPEAKQSSEQRHFEGLVDAPKVTGNFYGGSTPTNGAIKNTGPLSLEEKKRLAAEQEANLTLRSQAPLMNSKTANSSAPSLNAMMNASQQKPKPVADFDVSSFLPPPSTSGPVLRPSSSAATSRTGLAFPEVAAFSTTKSNDLFWLQDAFANSKVSGPVPQKIAPPPSVSNSNNRPSMAKPSGARIDLSAFDSLTAFPTTSRPASRTSGAPSMLAMQKNNAAPPKQRDPFDDLLG
uniref:SCY1-like protein 2 n=1 Tax=Steinernema glaseri TaxID=37863 RepID=A0A1I7ZPE8_9BILA